MIKYERYFKHISDEKSATNMMNTFGALTREVETGRSGYYNLPKDSLSVIKDAEYFIQSEDGYYLGIDTIVVVGIGGSSLGTKAIYNALKHKYDDIKRMLFLENPDPISLSSTFLDIQKEKSLFVIVSKSGSTIETMSIFKAIIKRYELDFNKEDKKRVAVITDEGSPLCKYADTKGLKAFIIPSNVGGRFSVLSSVGVVPLVLAGFNVKDILKGAGDFVERFFDSKEEHLLLKADFLTTYAKKYPMSVLFSYSDVLEDFTKWFVQLWGESLGKIDKDGCRVGLAPVGHIGSVDQHSFLQLLVEGPRDKTVTFIKIENFENDIKIPDITLDGIGKCDYVNGYTFNELLNAECDATKESLIKQEVPIDMISLDKLNEQNVGELIAYFEILTSACGIMLGVDTYNQPGVEEGKRILVSKFS